MYNVLMNFKNPTHNNLTSFVGRKNATGKTRDNSFNSILGEKTTTAKEDHYKSTKNLDQTKIQNIKTNQQTKQKEVQSNKKLNSKEKDKTVDNDAEVIDKDQDSNVVKTDERTLLDIVELMNSLVGILENISPSTNDDPTATVKDFKLAVQELQSLLEGNSIAVDSLKLGNTVELKQMLEDLLVDLKVSMETTSMKSLVEDMNESLLQVNALIDQLKEKIELYQSGATVENFINNKDQENDQAVSYTPRNTNTDNNSVTTEVQTYAEQEKSMQQDQKNANNPMNSMDKEQKGFMANEVFKDIPFQTWTDTNTNPIDISKIETMNTSKTNFVNILEQVVEKAEIFLGEKNSEMILQLKPDHLGKLSMKIAVEKGIVIANIVAENQAVKEILESNFNMLKDALNEKGFGIQELNVSVGQNNDFEKQQQFMKSQKKGNSKALSKILSTDQQVFIEEEQTSKTLTATNFDYLA